MKKFKIIFLDARTGHQHDLYDSFVVEAPKMSDVAIHLEHLQAKFRLIEDVTAVYPTSFTPNPWDTIPARAF